MVSASIVARTHVKRKIEEAQKREVTVKNTASFDQSSTRSLVDFVAKHADSVLERCRDRYGSKETPLFTDGIYLKTGEPRISCGHWMA